MGKKLLSLTLLNLDRRNTEQYDHANSNNNVRNEMNSTPILLHILIGHQEVSIDTISTVEEAANIRKDTVELLEVVVVLHTQIQAAVSQTIHKLTKAQREETAVITGIESMPEGRDKVDR